MPEHRMPNSQQWLNDAGEVVNDLVAELGLTRTQAAGIVGNLGYESRGFTELQEQHPQVPGSRGGFGWAQWTGPRRREFEAYAAKAGLSPTSHKANYSFLVHELRTTERNFTTRLRTQTTLYGATRLTHLRYERPADQSEGATAARMLWATTALQGASQAEPGAIA